MELHPLDTRFWAKAGNAAAPTFHPLACHLADVGFVCRLMWAEVLKASVRQRVCEALQLDDAAASTWVAFWVGAHDIGKLSPGFQRKRPEKCAELASMGYTFPDGDTPHGTVSTAVLAELLANPVDWPALGRDLAQRVAVAIGGHHGTFPTTAQWDGSECRNTLGDARWARARKTMIGWLAHRLGADQAPPPTCPSPTDHAVFMILAGLTSVADWIGSNTTFFPPAGDDVDLTVYLQDTVNRARNALREMGWTGWDGTTEGRTFKEMFGFEPRGLQTEAVAQAARLDRPGLVLIEAPMGEGKTEAALYLADHWSRTLGQQGLYVALPTQATSNQMFSRVHRFLAERYPADRVNLHLLHGHADFSAEYEKLRLAAIYDDDHAPGKIVAESWFAAKKKQALLAPFGVGTIDQALLAVLQTKHVFVRLFALAGKTIILDEVHAYDAYMSSLMERLLQWLSALDCSVVLLSATLPAGKRSRLLKAWDPNAGEPTAPYPRLTVLRRGFPALAVSTLVPADRRTRVALRWLAPDGLTQALRVALAGGGCAAVIVNTVGEAQLTFRRLSDMLRAEGFAIELFHARFPFGRRQEIENAVLSRYGKAPAGSTTNPLRPYRAVLVATQVIEQSLDIDFDLLVTAVAPVDLVMQRAGRLHRHQRTRPAGLVGPELWLLRPAFVGSVPTFDTSEYVYDRHILLRSYLALRDRSAASFPDDLEPLIELVYGAGQPPAPDAAWQAELDRTLRELASDQKKHRGMARQLLIAPADAEDNIFEDFSKGLEEDNASVSPQLQALTRLSEPTVTAVCLYRTAAGLSLSRDGSEGIDVGRKPTPHECRALLHASVSLSHRGVVGTLLGSAGPAGWKERPVLSDCRVLELNGAGECTVGNYKIRLDDELGIVIEKGAAA
jgi:CRISPR-associated endonuclease/helicase Cas3